MIEFSGRSRLDPGRVPTKSQVKYMKLLMRPGNPGFVSLSLIYIPLLLSSFYFSNNSKRKWDKRDAKGNTLILMTKLKVIFGINPGSYWDPNRDHQKN